MGAHHDDRERRFKAKGPLPWIQKKCLPSWRKAQGSSSQPGSGRAHLPGAARPPARIKHWLLAVPFTRKL
jgi:hypothetical protein